MKSLGKAIAVHYATVDESAAGQRIDNFLMRFCKGVPKSHVYRILRSGEVRVNGGRVDQTRRLALGDVVRVPPVRVSENRSPAVPVGEALPVVFEDEALLVLNKPAGLAVHGGSGVSFGVIEQLRRQRPEARFLELAHRLDRETSGLLIVAKKRSALTALHEMLREGGGVQKTYLALVAGRWMNPLQHVKAALHKYLTPEGERRVRVDREGKPAHSIVRLQARWNAFSLVEVELRTGRTHQIRVHLSHLGFPLAGDDKYGDFALNKRLEHGGLKRMFLHAARLRLKHPLSGETLALEAPLPPELQAYLDQLDREGAREYG